MLKTVLRNHPYPNDFSRGALEIIKNIDNLAIPWVKRKCQELVNSCKDTKNLSVNSNIDSKIVKYPKSGTKPITKVLLLNTEVGSKVNSKYATKQFTPQKMYQNRATNIGRPSSAMKSVHTKLLYNNKVRHSDFQNKPVKSYAIDLCPTTGGSSKKITKIRQPSIISQEDNGLSYQRPTTASAKRVRNKARFVTTKVRQGTNSTKPRVITPSQRYTK